MSAISKHCLLVCFFCYFSLFPFIESFICFTSFVSCLRIYILTVLVFLVFSAPVFVQLCSSTASFKHVLTYWHSLWVDWPLPRLNLVQQNSLLQKHWKKKIRKYYLFFLSLQFFQQGFHALNNYWQMGHDIEADTLVAVRIEAQSFL